MVDKEALIKELTGALKDSEIWREKVEKALNKTLPILTSIEKSLEEECKNPIPSTLSPPTTHVQLPLPLKPYTAQAKSAYEKRRSETSLKNTRKKQRNGNGGVNPPQNQTDRFLAEVSDQTIRKSFVLNGQSTTFNIRSAIKAGKPPRGYFTSQGASIVPQKNGTSCPWKTCVPHGIAKRVNWQIRKGNGSFVVRKRDRHFSVSKAGKDLFVAEVVKY